MKISTLMDVITAAHLTASVKSPYQQRGGILLVAPPASLKTTVIELLDTFPNATALSDINVKTLTDLREDLSTGRYVTLAFPELEKIYKRQVATANNIEGHLKAMVEEGFRHASFEDHRMVTGAARCLVIAGMTSALYRSRFTDWTADGFARRFIWSHFRLGNPRVLIDAVMAWKKINIITRPVIFGLPVDSIPYCVSDAENMEMDRLLKQQQDGSAFVLLKKILCVLKWRYPRTGDFPMSLIADFATSFHDVVELEIDGEPDGDGLLEDSITEIRRVRVAEAVTEKAVPNPVVNPVVNSALASDLKRRKRV